MRRSFDSMKLIANPYDSANYLSKWTFWYTIPFFKRGCHREITEADLTTPLDAHKSSIVGDRLSTAWSKEVGLRTGTKRKPSLHKALHVCFGNELVFYGFLAVVAEIGIRVHQPLFIGLLLRYFDSRNDNKPVTNKYPMYFNRFFRYYNKETKIEYAEAVLYVIAIIMCSALNFFMMHPVMMAVGHVGMKMRVAACSLMYRKALRLSYNSLAGKTVGNVMNLMANDVNRFDNVTMFTPYIFIGPAQMLFALYFIYFEVGNGAFFGILVVLCAIIIQVNLGQCTIFLRRRTAKKTDDRVFLTNEIIRGMQVIKMYGWEYVFEKVVRQARKRELLALIQNSYIKGTIMSFIMFTTRFAVFITVFYCVFIGQHLTVEKVFFIVGYYQIMRHTMTVNFPQGIANLAEFDVAIERIRAFLLLEESIVGDPTPMRHKGTVQQMNYMDEDRKPSDSVILTNVSCKYGESLVLQNINLEIVKGRLAVIVGEVGAGKSCVLHLIMGELLPTQGSIAVNGVISYASQEPWLFAASVRQNIVFGQQYDRERYQQVVQLCALARDFTLLPYGDRTIVGERGISLSGGQRARVNLARAIYKQADIYLLDDPLSAVDPSVSKHLFEKCIRGYLSNKIVILCTHQLQHLKNVEQIIVMKNGKIQLQGSFNQIQTSELSYAKYFKDSTVEPEHNVAAIVSNIPLKVIEKDHPEKIPTADAEERTVGKMSCGVYSGYAKAGGNWFMVIMVGFLFLLSQAFISCADYFMNEWIQSDQNYYIYKKPLVTSYQKFCRKSCLYMFCGSIGALTIVSLTRSYYFYYFCMRASNKLHRLMFECIIKTRMNFYYTNTSGRILNRFSKDLGTVDEYLPNSFIDFNQLFLNMIGTVIIFGIISLYLLIPSAILIGCFFLVRNIYMRTARSVKRLEGTTKSPVYSHLNASLQGLGTIRTHGQEMLLVEEFDRYQDDHSSAFFIFTVTSRAFGYVMDFLCVFYIMSVTVFFFLPFNHNPSDAGLCITQGMGLTGIFQWGMRQSAELENLMTSVERVLEYTKLDMEPKFESDPEHQPPPGWPQHGRIEFRNTCLKYSLLEPNVLNSISFVINPKEKVGIVGRTGAGKSSLIGALFRLTYITGEIIIDDIETGSIGLHDLRKNISIIPQEPILFTGTMRSNLDPFNEYDDKSMYKALIDVEIRLAIEHGIKCLDHYMAEGGINFSVGERQLICLARAIIRNNSILILDEATANVDPHTDKFIQATIRTAFANCTVLTIAHRINTIIDCDKVLVMDAGKCAELDHPHTLLRKPNSIFSKMIDKTGSGTSQQLRKEAQESYERKFGKSPTIPQTTAEDAD